MRYKTLLVEKSGNMTTVTLNRPHILNALNTELLLELKDLLDNFRGDDKTRFVIFTGAGKAFSCGAESTKETLKEKRTTNQRIWQLFAHDFMHTMENLEQVMASLKPMRASSSPGELLLVLPP